MPFTVSDLKRRMHPRVWALLAAVGGAALLSGCVVAPVDDGHVDYGYTSTTVYTTYGHPPPPRVEYRTIAPSPHHIWVGGDWLWSGSRYHWRPGRWAPPGHRWAPPPPPRPLFRPDRHPRPPHIRPDARPRPPQLRPQRPDRPPHMRQQAPRRDEGGERRAPSPRRDRDDERRRHP